MEYSGKGDHAISRYTMSNGLTTALEPPEGYGEIDAALSSATAKEEGSVPSSCPAAGRWVVDGEAWRELS